MWIAILITRGTKSPQTQAPSHHVTVDRAWRARERLKVFVSASLSRAEPRNELTTTELLSRLPAFISLVILTVSYQLENPDPSSLLFSSSPLNCVYHASHPLSRHLPFFCLLSYHPSFRLTLLDNQIPALSSHL